MNSIITIVHATKTRHFGGLFYFTIRKVTPTHVGKWSACIFLVIIGRHIPTYAGNGLVFRKLYAKTRGSLLLAWEKSCFPCMMDTSKGSLPLAWKKRVTSFGYAFSLGSLSLTWEKAWHHLSGSEQNGITFTHVGKRLGIYKQNSLYNRTLS